MQFSVKSEERLATCDERLQRLFREVIKERDCTVLCGHRGEAEQNEAVAKGVSKTKWPTSKHNSMPSRAVDVMPYPIDWEDKPRIAEFAKYTLAKAKELNINIRWGGDWDRDGEWKDEKFLDMPHFELIGD